MREQDNFLTETHAVGGGEWSLEVYFWNHDGDKEFVTEYVGSNGTRDESADDLWQLFYDNIEAAKGLNGVLFGGGFIAK